MTPFSNTPPDGDFARYVEDLTRRNALAAPRPDMMKPAGGATASVSPPPAGGTASAPAPPPPAPDRPAGPEMSLVTHLKWVIAAWIGTQFLARIIPWAGFLFVPVLLVYGAWVIFRAYPSPTVALKKQFRELAESLRKAQAADKPPRP